MTWQQTEFLLKGVYLGLLLMVAWLRPTWPELATIGASSFAGLALFLSVAAVRKIREGFRIGGRLLGFLLFLVLENPRAVYSGLIIGLALGAGVVFRLRGVDLPFEVLFPVAGGAVLGVVFYLLRIVNDRKTRGWLCLALAVLLIGGPAALIFLQPELLSPEQLRMIGVLLLAGIPGFYLLTFASLVEESEIEIAALCAALALGSWMLLSPQVSPAFGGFLLAFPLVLYYLYTRRILPGLRVFKHALRGLSFREVGNTRLALLSLNRALQLDPNHPLARQQLWEIHRSLDLEQLRSHPDLAPMLNFSLCLERVSGLLLQPKPNPQQIDEAMQMIDLIASQQPPMRPACSYWRAVAFTHRKDYAQATEQLEFILKLPQNDTDWRRSVHFAAWLLALDRHPELIKRVGEPLLRQPGQRLDAIIAVERELSFVPQDPSAWALKRMLYSEMTEEEYNAVAPTNKSLAGFDHEYAKQLGLALLDDRSRWLRGCMYLRLAARGLPAQAAGIYIQIAQAHEKANDLDGMWANYQHALQLGRAFGIANLPKEEQQSLLAVVKKIGDNARVEGRIDAALEAYKFLAQQEDAGITTYRVLADLFEQKKEVWHALHCASFALTYNASDKDLLERKDRYYYSITPEEVTQRWEQVKAWFDVAYCLDKAKWALDQSVHNLEMLDWSSHLAELAQAAQPQSITARFLRARIKRMRGDVEDAIALLEEIRKDRPAKFASEEEELAWYYAHRMLGDYYLDTKPAEAIPCLLEFKKCTQAGADTAYKLGRAFESTGDLARAARCYQEVTIFTSHPLYFDARDALARVQSGGGVR